MTIGFLTEPEPPRRQALPVRPGIARMVANNPGPMTYHGTNSWIVEDPEGLTVIDPGPDEPDHLAALAALGRVTGILLTHTHADHAAGAGRLSDMTGARVHGWHAPLVLAFGAGAPLADGAQIGPLTAIHTPGHAPDHLCFALPDGVLFTGDHVMSWSTSVVIPPEGRMAEYLHSLRRLLVRPDTLYLPGHGPPLPEPARLVRALLAHRLAREAAVRRALTAAPQTAPGLVPGLYGDLPHNLARAAAQTVQAHLIKLHADGHAEQRDHGWVKAGG